jgi:CBS domain-containing protein
MVKSSVRHLPVVDARHRLVGILSDRDLLGAVRRGTRARPVRDHVTEAPRTVTPDTPAHVAADLMIHGRFGALPVVDTAGHLLGIITETDLLEVARIALLAEPPPAP